MEIRLIALPWPAVDHPPAALASLAPFLRKNNPGCRVENLYSFLDVMGSIGRNFYNVYSRADLEGDLLYAGLFYPEKRDDVLQHTQEFLDHRGLDPLDPDLVDSQFRGDAVTWSEIVAKLLATLEVHVEELAKSVMGVDAVGLTTCFNQLFANLCLARYIKQMSPETAVVLGGSTVSGASGASLIQEYPMVDYIVQGEGELPLSALVNHIRGKARPEMEPRAVLSKRNAAENPHGVALWEVPNLDELAFPDYSGFAVRAEAADISWSLPIEGSRGCWWDRIKRTNDARNACYFCSLNVQWDRYREKSVDRLSREVDRLSDQYGNPVIVFLDNIMRFKGIDELSAALMSHQRDYVFGHELRASIAPYDLVRLWEAGLRIAEIGIDGLSPSYLRRIGKGTTTIQNLQAMKTAYELQIDNQGNLIVDFPGSDQQDVAETCNVILENAIAYQPLNISEFKLGQGSTVERLSVEFGASKMRNADLWKVGLPAEVYDRLVLFDRVADFPTRVDWTPLRTTVCVWRREHDGDTGPSYRRYLLWYADGRSYLRIADRRSGKRMVYTLRNEERLIYLRCFDITSLRELREEFCETDGVPEDQLGRFLQWAVERHLIFRENQEYLSLAPALSPSIAARRIKKAHARRCAVSH